MGEWTVIAARSKSLLHALPVSTAAPRVIPDVALASVLSQLAAAQQAAEPLFKHACRVAHGVRNMCDAFGAHGQAASVHHPKPAFGLRLAPVYRGIPGIVCRERPSAAITCSLTRWLRVCLTLTPSLTHAHRPLTPRPMLPPRPSPAEYSMVLVCK